MNTKIAQIATISNFVFLISNPFYIIIFSYNNGPISCQNLIHQKERRPHPLQTNGRPPRHRTRQPRLVHDQMAHRPQRVPRQHERPTSQKLSPQCRTKQSTLVIYL